MRLRTIALVLFLLLNSRLIPDEVYAVSRSTPAVFVLETDTFMIISTITTGFGAGDVVFSPGGDTAYVTNPLFFSLNGVSLIDTEEKRVIATITVGDGSGGLSVSPDGTTLYVINIIGKSLSIVDTFSRQAIATITFTTGGNPRDVVATPDGNFVYASVSAGGSSFFSVIDPGTKSIIATIPTGADCFSMTVTPDSQFLYSGYGPSIVTVVSTASQSVVATITTGAGTGIDAAITPDGARLYFPSRNPRNVVMVIDAASKTLVATITVLTDPTSVTITTDGQLGIVGKNLGPPFLVAFDTDSNLLTSNMEGTTSIWKLATKPLDSPPPPPPPTSAMIVASANTIANTFLTQIDLTNNLEWSIVNAPTVAQFRIYRDETFTDLITTIPVGGSLEFKDHNRMPKTTYTYSIVAEDGTGAELVYASVSITTP